jgi:hypothetical protein
VRLAKMLGPISRQLAKGLGRGSQRYAMMLNMRELHGVVRFGCSEEQLKRQAIIFDRFHVVHMDHGFGRPNDDQKAAEWDALESLGIAEAVPEHFGDEVTMAELFAFSGYRSDASALDSYVRYAASKFAIKIGTSFRFVNFRCRLVQIHRPKCLLACNEHVQVLVQHRLPRRNRLNRF